MHTFTVPRRIAVSARIHITLVADKRLLLTGTYAAYIHMSVTARGGRQIRRGGNRKLVTARGNRRITVVVTVAVSVLG